MSCSKILLTTITIKMKSYYWHHVRRSDVRSMHMIIDDSMMLFWLLFQDSANNNYHQNEIILLTSCASIWRRINAHDHWCQYDVVLTLAHYNDTKRIQLHLKWPHRISCDHTMYWLLIDENVIVCLALLQGCLWQIKRLLL